MLHRPWSRQLDAYTPEGGKLGMTRTANLSLLVELLDALEGTATAAWAWDIKANVVQWSPNTGPLYGRDRGYQPASYEEWLSLIEPEDRPWVAQVVAGAVNGGEDYEIELRTRWPDNSQHWLWARAHVVTDERGAPARLVGVVSDVTAAKRQRERERFLSAASDLLASTNDVQEVLRRSAGLVVQGLADWCSVQLLDGQTVETAVVAHRDPDMVKLAERLQEDYPPDDKLAEPASQVVESGEPVLVEEIPHEMLVAVAVDEAHLAILESLGLRSVLIAPIAARGMVLGLITLVSAESDYRFGPDDIDLAVEFGRRSGLALDNARLHAKTQQVARTLQAALAPPREPGRLGLQAEAWYRPAGIGDVGGDWYDVVDTPDGTHVYVIGDVVGRGIEAVAAMAELRFGLRMLLMEGRSPSQALAALDPVARSSDAFCSTVLCAKVDPATHTVRVASAGHLRPIVTGPDGAWAVHMDIGPPIGLGGPRPDEHMLTLSTGQCLILYTDGVCERRDQDIDTSLRALIKTVGECDPSDVAAALRRMADDVGCDDDATVVVVSVPNPDVAG